MQIANMFFRIATFLASALQMTDYMQAITFKHLQIHTTIGIW